MKHMTLEHIAAACGGTYYGSQEQCRLEVSGIAIDSRKIKKGYLFVPIKGARVDGHDFIPQVMEQGALCTLSEHILENAAFSYILVDSCEQALKDIAGFYRDSLDIKVVGISGSVGKTSTKEMIASVLSQKYQVLKTEGNYNNEIGLPLTIFNITEEHEVAVLEMGISDFGEMHRLASVAKPDICVITNIGMAHLENLKSRDGILKAKTEMFDHMKPDAAVILNGDDDKLCTVTETHGISPVFFGLSAKHDIYADHIENLGLMGTGCDIHLPADIIHAVISIPGGHMVYNALAGAAVGHSLGLTAAEIKAGIEDLKPVSGRNHIIEQNGLTIIDDCYNANPVSMKASLDVLSTASGRKVAIMGDMFELGENEKELHREVGRHAAGIGIDVICCVGDLSSETAGGAKEVSGTHTLLYYPKKKDLLEDLSHVIQKGDTVLVKASHGMEFPEVIDALTDLAADQD